MSCKSSLLASACVVYSNTSFDDLQVFRGYYRKEEAGFGCSSGGASNEPSGQS